MAWETGTIITKNFCRTFEKYYRVICNDPLLYGYRLFNESRSDARKNRRCCLLYRFKGKVKEAFNKEFFDPKTAQYGTGSQASYAMPLYAGLVDPQYKQAVLANLVKDIENTTTN